MCGITGMTLPDKNILRKMTATLIHRGPDSSGFFFDEKIGLGHRRLSIIDLSKKGKQPMRNEKEDMWITYNGEVYNHAELRTPLEKKRHHYESNTDTETIIHGYEEYGTEILQKINGDFAFCIYDINKQLLFLARDRIGVKPLYYYHQKGLFLFASEIKALLEHPAVPRIVNKNALRQFLTYRYVFSAETMFKNIYRLPAAHYILYDIKKKTINIQKYWDVNSSAKNIIKAPDSFHIQKYRELLLTSTERRLMSDVPLGAYLSGGIDSSSIVAALTQVKKKHGDNDPLRTFSIGFTEGINELPYAKAVAEHAGTEHTEIMMESNTARLLPQIVYQMDEPLADPAELPVFILSRETKKQGVTVILTGDGGDETLAGYEQAKFIKTAHYFRTVPSQIRKLAVRCGMKILPDTVKDRLFKYASKLGPVAVERATALASNVSSVSEMYKNITALFSNAELQELAGLEPRDELSNFLPPRTHPLINRILHLELKTLLPENMLMKSDKMTMAWGIEGRVPLLDHELVEYTFKMPPNLKLRGFNEKYALKKAVQEWLPKKVLQRKKQRFYVPIDEWLKKDLSEMADTLLSPDILKRQGFFSPNAVAKIRERYNHAPLYYARQLWTLLNFQLWHAIFIEKKSLKEISP